MTDSKMQGVRAQPLRPLADIRADLLAAEAEVTGLLNEILGGIAS